MPYQSDKDFKTSTTGKRVAKHFGGKVPAGVNKQFRKIVNSMIARGYSEERAIRAAWSAIKKR